MKTMFKTAGLILILLLACKSRSSEDQTSTTMSDNKQPEGLSPQVDTLKNYEAINAIDSINTFSINEIITEYLNLKNALTLDNSKDAALASKSLLTAMSKMNLNSLTTELQQVYKDLAEDITENAEHISDNAGKIEHQREHFAILSRDINDLLIKFKTDKKLYQDFCHMYDGGKGAIWISETKEIKNPYYGSKMLSCGSVKKEL